MDMPNRKVIAQAVTTLAVAALAAVGFDADAEAAGAIGVLVGVVVAYIVPDAK